MVNEMFSVSGIGSYIPALRSHNYELADSFAYPMASVIGKIGFVSTARKESCETVSDMCIKAWHALEDKIGSPLREDLDLVILVTQHPEGNGIPHTSAIVHSKLQLPIGCFAFDVSLGCSGFVAALAVAKGYLASTGGSKAIVFTCDPYSQSISRDDKNTAMIFGDAATATLISRSDQWPIGDFDLGTSGQHFDALMRDADGILRMKGRTVFNFCAKHIPESVNRVLSKAESRLDDLDFLVLHPGSKYIVDTIRSRLGLSPLDSLRSIHYGNTISSSIPLILQDIPMAAKVIASGFGVGLGWATCSLGLTK